MNSASEDIATYFASLPAFGPIGGLSAFAIYVNDEPAKPDDVITLYDAPSPSPARAMNNKTVKVKFTNFLIRVRGVNQKTTYDKIDELYTALNDIESWITVNDTNYMNFEPTTDIFRLQRDDNKRWVFAVNYQTTRK